MTLGPDMMAVAFNAHDDILIPTRSFRPSA